MSTPAIISYRYLDENNQPAVKKAYTFYDGYLEDLGANLVKFIKKNSVKKLIEFARNLKLVDPSTIPDVDTIRLCKKVYDYDPTNNFDYYYHVKYPENEGISFDEETGVQNNWRTLLFSTEIDPSLISPEAPYAMEYPEDYDYCYLYEIDLVDHEFRIDDESWKIKAKGGFENSANPIKELLEKQGREEFKDWLSTAKIYSNGPENKVWIITESIWGKNLSYMDTYLVKNLKNAGFTYKKR